MTPQQFRRVQSVFHEARQVPLTEREEFLVAACADDMAVRQEVNALFESMDPAQRLTKLRNEVGDILAPIFGTTSDLKPSDTIGPYRIDRLLGEGGMGTVYLAQQAGPLHRAVALKVIKVGMDTKQTLARFENEREALALMNHSNVARVFDAGVTPQGRPYFAMEYVEGEPITVFCDRHQLSIEDRLRLFMDVCRAVQHAHQKGIIHRDLKPSNVLVSTDATLPAIDKRGPEGGGIAGSPPLGRGRLDGVTVKVIDFGVAKATQRRSPDRTVFTEQGQFIGTPGYMSPEQVEMASPDIDTRTDIYSLGVLLYELLVGTRPFDDEVLRNAGYAEFQRIICEVDPPKPSTRVESIQKTIPPKGSESPANVMPIVEQEGLQGGSCDSSLPDHIARNRGVRARTLFRQLRGDLDWIVMKCLEKDRSRRYETANALVMDIERHVRREPVLASPPSTIYRIRKFVRRNRFAVVAAAAIMLALSAGLASTSAMYVRSESLRQLATDNAEKARLEAERATSERDRTDRFAVFMEQTLEGVGPSVALGRDSTMLKEMMDAAANRIVEEKLDENPAAELRLRLAIGNVYRQIAEFEAAEKMLTPAVELALALEGRESITYALAVNHRAMLFESKGLPSVALPEFEEARSILQVLFPGDNSDVAMVINNIASCQNSLGRSHEALPLHEESLAMRRRLTSGVDDLSVAYSLNGLAQCLDTLGRSSEALPKYEEALSIRQRLLPGDHPDIATSLNNEAVCLNYLGRSAEALVRYQEVLVLRQRLFPKDHPSVARVFGNIGSCLYALGRSNEALSNFEESLAMSRRLFSSDHPDIAQGANNVGACLMSLGRSAESLPKHEEALAMRRRLFAGDHPSIATSLNNVAGALSRLGRYAEALPTFEEALAMTQRIYHGDHPSNARGLHNVADCLAALDRPNEALARFHEALAMFQRIYATDHPNLAICMKNIGRCLESLGRPRDAMAMYEDALAMIKRLFPGDHPEVVGLLNGIGGTLEALDRHAEALPMYEEALAMSRRLHPEEHPDTASSLNNIALCLDSLGQSEEALPKLQEALDIYRRFYPGDHPFVATTLTNVASCLDSLGLSGDATLNFEEALAMQMRMVPPTHIDVLSTKTKLGRALANLSRHSEAEELLVSTWEAIEERDDVDVGKKQKCLNALAHLYESWNLAEPDQGYDEKATEWRDRLDDFSSPPPG